MSLEIDREHPHVINSRANPMRNLVTDLSCPGYNINININKHEKLDNVIVPGDEAK